MGAGLVLLFWLFVAAIYGVCWLIFLLLFLAGRRKKSRLLIWLSGLPLALSTSGAVLAAGMMIYGLIYVSIPSNVYKISFDRAPSSDVTNLRSHYFCFADSGVTYLRFNAAPPTIEELTRKGWIPITGQQWQREYSSFFDKEGAPRWWTPGHTKTIVYYKAENRIHSFAGESEVLTYDATTRQTFYAFSGID